MENEVGAGQVGSLFCGVKGAEGGERTSAMGFPSFLIPAAVRLVDVVAAGSNDHGATLVLCYFGLIV